MRMRTKRTTSRGFVPDFVARPSISTHALKRPSGNAHVPMHEHMWSNIRFTMIQPEFFLRFPIARISMRCVDGVCRNLHVPFDSRTPDRYGMLSSIHQSYQQTTR